MTETKNPRPRRSFTDEFKNQIVQLHASGKRKCDIMRDYQLTASLMDRWIKQANTSGSFKEKDNRTPEEQELIELRKRNMQLEMENDILKQAALILGQK